MKSILWFQNNLDGASNIDKQNLNFERMSDHNGDHCSLPIRTFGIVGVIIQKRLDAKLSVLMRFGSISIGIQLLMQLYQIKEPRFCSFPIRKLHMFPLLISPLLHRKDHCNPLFLPPKSSIVH